MLKIPLRGPEPAHWRGSVMELSTAVTSRKHSAGNQGMSASCAYPNKEETSTQGFGLIIQQPFSFLPFETILRFWKGQREILQNVWTFHCLEDKKNLL